MTALCVALVLALGLALCHSDQGKRPPAGNEDTEGSLWVPAATGLFREGFPPRKPNLFGET